MPLQILEELIIKKIFGNKSLEVFRKGDLPKSIIDPFIPEIIKLSEAYNYPERLPSTALQNKASLEAYMLYFLPINYVKLSFLMEKISWETEENIKVLDFGCGPGTGALTALSKFNHPSISVFDISRSAEELAVSLLKELDPRAKIEKPGKKWMEEKFDLIITANSLNEIPESEREILAGLFITCLKDGGHLIILEPALKVKTRASMKLRDFILNKNNHMTPIFPCTRKDNCPMLRDNPEDWCHGSLNWEGSRLVKQIDRITGFNKHRLKYSAFIFEKNGEMLPGYRVVSIPKKGKVGTSSYLCGKDFYELVKISKRERSDKTKLFEKSELWDRLPELPI